MKAKRKQKPKRAPQRTSPAPIPVAEKPVEVKVTPAKGRPMLVWVGKKPLSRVMAYPAQHVESHDALRILKIPVEDVETHEERLKVLRTLREYCNEECWKDHPEYGPRVPELGGLLFHGDNKDVLAHLLANGFRGQINLVYIDPPFDSGADYVRRVSLRGPKGTAKVEGESYTLGEQIQYTDIWVNDNYLQFMYERLILIKELLAENGFIFVQCDHRKNHHLRNLMDEVFGPDNFRNEIASRRGITSVQAQFESIEALIPGYYTTLFYSKSGDAKLPILRTKRVAIQLGKWDTLWRNHDRPTMRYELCGVTPKEGQWRWSEDRGKKAEANYKHYLEKYAESMDLDQYITDHFNSTGELLEFVRLGPDGTVQCWIPAQVDRLANNVWMDFPHMGQVSDYPTEKSERMLERVLGWASNPGNLVLDCFIGSGTTAAVAQRLGRRWIGCDINKGAIQTTVKRLRSIIEAQIVDVQKRAENDRQKKLPGSEEDPFLKPAQFGFNVHRVNDYDLAIQHNEAVNLACEAIGVQRTRTDAYFDGTLGRALVKIVPFGHPLTPLDVEELKRELEARPDEDRPVTLVSLGVEIAAQAWVEDWNRLRKGKDAVNRIQVIDLRSDPKHGGFIRHEPAQAKVNIVRKKDKIIVEIEDFISPTIVERLRQQAGILQPKIDDWRSMADCVMIDTAYDGKVFNVVLSDVPAGKTGFVQGRYELPAPSDETTVAVKIIDMLGEEVCCTEEV